MLVCICHWQYEITKLKRNAHSKGGKKWGKKQYLHVCMQYCLCASNMAKSVMICASHVNEHDVCVLKAFICYSVFVFIKNASTTPEMCSELCYFVSSTKQIITWLLQLESHVLSTSDSPPHTRVVLWVMLPHIKDVHSCKHVGAVGLC